MSRKTVKCRHTKFCKKNSSKTSQMRQRWERTSVLLCKQRKPPIHETKTNKHHSHADTWWPGVCVTTWSLVTTVIENLKAQPQQPHQQQQSMQVPDMMKTIMENMMQAMIRQFQEQLHKIASSAQQPSPTWADKVGYQLSAITWTPHERISSKHPRTIDAKGEE